CRGGFEIFPYSAHISAPKMQDVPNSCGVLAFSTARSKPLALRVGWEYFVPVFNGSGSPGMAGRDTDATWRSLSTLCRELDWSRPRLVHELRNGLPYRTFPPGHTVDWHHPEAEQTLNIAASEVTITQTVLMADGLPDLVRRTLGIEVLPPTDAEVPLPAASTPKVTTASSRWAVAATRNLRAEKKKIPEGVTKAELARLLEGEAKKAVRAGQIKRALTAAYIENQLGPWGIWPLSSLK
ncbi:MAG: hypothetical protein WAN75_14820, partial [Xanthobacteraceae bacterium]